MLKKYLAILAYLFLTCTALDISALARIENWDKVRRNIIVLKHDEYKVDQKVLEEIKDLDRARLILTRKAARFIDIYLPSRHQIFEHGLLREGRTIELSDVVKMDDHLKEKRKLFFVEHIDTYNDLTNILSKNVLNRLRYDGEKYIRVSGFVWDEKEIIRVSGVQEVNLV